MPQKTPLRNDLLYCVGRDIKLLSHWCQNVSHYDSRPIFSSGTDLISYRYSSCCSCSCCYGATSSKKPKVPSFQVRSGIRDEIWRECFLRNYASTDVQDDCHDVISRRKVLPSDDCIQSVCPAHMQQRPPAARQHFCLDFLILSFIFFYRAMLRRVRLCHSKSSV